MQLHGYKRFSLLAVVIMGMSLVVSLFTAFPVALAQTNSFAHPSFEQEWQTNPDLWGNPGAIQVEPYREAKNGARVVQYFEKGRMELTRPDDTNSPTYTGDGRIVLEMISGRVQRGDFYYFQYDGAESPVSGDSTFATNSGAPSYRAFQSLLGRNAPTTGNPVRLALPTPEDESFFLRFASVQVDPALGTLATNVSYIQQTSHNVPDVFWNYLNQTKANGELRFNWRTLFGLPLTDAYWTKVRAGGAPQDILVQLYERRVLLYNPALPQGQQVYLGNVGTDYYRWRYVLPELPLVNDSVDPDEGNGSVTPKVAETGTIMRFRGSGFTPNEPVNAWLELVDEGNLLDYSSVPVVQIRSDGTFSFTLRVGRYALPTSRLRYVAVGAKSGNKVVLNVRIVGSTRFTPGYEEGAPNDAPDGVNAVFEKRVLRVGEGTNLVAIGFQPGERLRGWVTSPYNYVSTWEGLIFSFSNRLRNVPIRLFADVKGAIKIPFPSIGYPQPGVFAFTLQGTKSGKTAVAYFRVQAGAAPINDFFWGSPTITAQSDEPPVIPDAPRLDLNNMPSDMNQFRANPEIEVMEGE
jgi:hypothetical protein